MTITTVTQITKTAKKFGYTKTRGKNGSNYYERTTSDVKTNVRIRFSDHFLGTDWTGRAQTGGATADIVDWKNEELTQDRLDLMFRFPERAEEILCDSNIDEDSIKNDYAQYLKKLAENCGPDAEPVTLLEFKEV